MILDRELIDQGTGFYRRCLGIITAGEIKEAIRTTRRNVSNYPNSTYGIFDLSDVNGVDISYIEMDEIVQFCREHNLLPNLKHLAIVATRPITFGVSRMFQGLCIDQPCKVGVFGSTDEALKWLSSIYKNVAII